MNTKAFHEEGYGLDTDLIIINNQYFIIKAKLVKNDRLVQSFHSEAYSTVQEAEDEAFRKMSDFVAGTLKP